LATTGKIPVFLFGEIVYFTYTLIYPPPFKLSQAYLKLFYGGIIYTGGDAVAIVCTRMFKAIGDGLINNVQRD
jgi:hypothetical protein